MDSIWVVSYKTNTDEQVAAAFQTKPMAFHISAAIGIVLKFAEQLLEHGCATNDDGVVYNLSEYIKAGD